MGLVELGGLSRQFLLKLDRDELYGCFVKHDDLDLHEQVHDSFLVTVTWLV